MSVFDTLDARLVRSGRTELANCASAQRIDVAQQLMQGPLHINISHTRETLVSNRPPHIVLCVRKFPALTTTHRYGSRSPVQLFPISIVYTSHLTPLQCIQKICFLALCVSASSFRVPSRLGKSFVIKPFSSATRSGRHGLAVNPAVVYGFTERPVGLLWSLWPAPRPIPR